MDPAEQALLQALQTSPEDWSIRLLVAEKYHERGASAEASALINESPNPLANAEQLQKAVTFGGNGVIPQVKEYVAAHPADGYGHEVLGILLQSHGDEEQAAKHFSVASALGNAAPPAAEIAPEQPAPEVVEHTDEAQAPALFSAPSPDAHDEQAQWQQPVYTDSADVAPKKQTSSKLIAVFVAIGLHVAVGLIAGFVILLSPPKDEPEIVAAVIGPPAAKREMQKKNVVKQVKKSTSASAAAAPVAKLMRASAMAKFSLPKVTKTSTGPLGMGEGNFGSGGFGGTGSGLGSGGSFFGGTSKGERFAFILDWSGSMKPGQVNLVIKEMDKTLKAFSPGVQYQVILFAGGGYYATPGWKLQSKKGRGNPPAPDNTMISPKGKAILFPTVNGYANYKFNGPDSQLPTEDWIKVTSANTKATMSVLKRKELYGGTDWRWPFKMALNLDPAPDVIFFMADGSGGANPPQILSYARKKNRTVQINMFGMETIAGAKEMAEISKATKGTYKIILSNGKTIDGSMALKDKAEALKRIKAGR